MKSTPRPSLRIVLFTATLACAGCLQQVAGPAGSGVHWNEIQQAMPYGCRSGVSHAQGLPCTSVARVSVESSQPPPPTDGTLAVSRVASGR